MPGPGKKPAHLKVVAGTDRPDRLPAQAVELPLVDAVPPAPDWLPNVHAVKEWERLAPILVSTKLLTEAALSALGHLCAVHGKLVQLWVAGEAPTGHMLAQFNKMVNDFGIPPVAQGKVRPGGKEESSNPYANRGTKPPAKGSKKA